MTTIINSTALHDNFWTWTITSRIGDMIEKAESKYGARDKTYSLLGIELTEIGHPYIWYRGADRKQIIIRINKECLNNLDYAVFQVSQEIIHCLGPTGTATANVLEEGVATHFGNEYYRSCGFSEWHVVDQKYLYALSLVQHLFTIDPLIIKVIRETEPIISNITNELLLKTNSNIPDILADELTRKF
jgi:hypothetical protein